MLLTAGADAGLVVCASLAGRSVFQLVSGHAVAIDTVTSIGIVAAILHLAVAAALRQYEFAALLVPSLRRTALTSATVSLLLTADLFALKAGADVSRGFLLTFVAVLLPFTVAARIAMAAVLGRLIAARVVCGRQSVLIGAADELDRLPARDLFRHFGLSEVARVTVPGAGVAPNTVLDRAAAEAVRLARTLSAEELVIAAAWARSDQLARLEDGLRLSPLPVRLLPDASARSLLARHGSTVFRLVDLQRAPVGPIGQVGKRLLDICIALGALVLLLPLLVGTAIALRLDSSGPIIFRQRRNGFDQRTFTIYKFRTMSVMEDHAAVAQASRDDARVTRVGRTLRRTSIDELPQLLNVLRGDMSIVGPRPHALAHDRLYGEAIDDYCVRHHVKPGMTGWAQVNGLRGETRDTTRMQQRVEYDLWYINNWSLWLDLSILMRTCREVLAHDAY